MATLISSLSIVDAKFDPLSDSKAKGGGQYTVWSKNCNSYFPAFGQAGKVLSNGVRNEPSFPRKDDCVKDEHGLDTEIQKYDDNSSLDEFGDPVAFEFIGDGRKDFKQHVHEYPAVLAAYNIGNNALATFLLLHLSPSVKMAFTAALLRACGNN